MMQKIIEELKKRGFVDNLQHCVNAATKVGGGKCEEAQLEASKFAFHRFMNKLDDNDELLDMVIEASTDMFAEALIKELDLKPDENYEPDEAEKLIGKLAEALAIIKNKEDK